MSKKRRTENIDRGHLLYPDVKGRQPEIVLPVWHGENWIAWTVLRRRRWSVGGLCTIIILSLVQLVWLLSRKVPQLFVPEPSEKDKEVL